MLMGGGTMSNDSMTMEISKFEEGEKSVRFSPYVSSLLDEQGHFTSILSLPPFTP